MKGNTRNKEEHIILKLNRYNASVLICSLAFICRYMYYGRVENVDIKFFYDNENFEDYYFDLRMLLNLLNEKSKTTFEEYKEFKICK